MKKTGTTLRALARHLELSPTTVSRALNGYPEVGAATRARVVAAAKALGYTPSAMARNLAFGRTGLVSVIVSYSAGTFVDPFFNEFLIGLSDRLRRHDLDLVITGVSDPAEEIGLYRRMIDSRRVDAFVVARTRVEDARVRLLADCGFPFVTHGRTSEAEHHDWIDTDGRAAFRKLTQWLIGLGHRRLAMLSAPPGYFFAHDRETGFREALEAHGLAPVGLGAVTTEALAEGSAVEAALRLLDGDDAPTALVCATDTLALGALKAAHMLGVAVPEQLTIVGHDDLPFSEFAHPPLTTLRQPLREAGALMADTVHQRLTAKPRKRLQTLLDSTLVERRSHGSAPGVRRTDPAAITPSLPS